MRRVHRAQRSARRTACNGPFPPPARAQCSVPVGVFASRRRPLRPQPPTAGVLRPPRRQRGTIWIFFDTAHFVESEYSDADTSGLHCH